ncbi:hypothetical protein D0869_05763 [Hortaea werneckii]|uniref:Xylanolytic transcriptional activator regulatory domain-containing protein n=1 Tax=Hortaea werneckii TaxID=91943 RepID=A0A3M6WW09_HORWE|nr:hypothetical protein D0869_05763 [Hortaea werneckii]
MRSNNTSEQESEFSPRQYQSADPPPPKRRRLSEQFSASDGRQREVSNANSGTGNLSSRRSPQKTGSSQERRGEMERSPSPAGSVRYTRTGRVSKAAKGQRVHACDECGKTRHDSTGPPTRPQSVVSGTSSDAPAGVPAHGPPVIYPSTAAERIDKDAPEYYTHGLGVLENQRTPASRDSRKLCYHPFNELYPINLSIATDSNNSDLAMLDSTFAQTSTYHSPSAYEPPPNGFLPMVSLPYYARCSAHVDYSLDRRDSCMAYSTNAHRPSAGSRSPGSESSSTSLLPPPWNDADLAANTVNISSFSSWDSCYGSPKHNHLPADDYVQVITNGLAGMMTASERDNMEFHDLMIPTTVPQEPWEETTFDDLAYTNEHRYLAAYWTWIHPQYPIVHKPTFDLDRTTPLLRASMLALGACMLHNETDVENASTIHERCVKVLKHRSVGGIHTFRICDMQAIVLTEIYAIFKSWNSSVQLTSPFLEVYTLLANDYEALRHHSADGEYKTPFDNDGHRTEVDSQYGSGKAIDVTCHSLPFPQAASSWDASPRQQLDADYQGCVASMPSFDIVSHALETLSDTPANAKPELDAFQVELLMACVSDRNTGADAFGSFSARPIDELSLGSASEFRPQTRLTYHLHMLCRNTPVQSLLSVAGEGWCVGQKLNSHRGYSKAQAEAYDWAKAAAPYHGEPTAIDQASFHARNILAIHRMHPRTGILYQEWALFLSAVVIWARAYVSSASARRRPRLSISIPDPHWTKHSNLNMEKTIMEVLGREAQSKVEGSTSQPKLRRSFPNSERGLSSATGLLLLRRSLSRR